MLIVQPSNIENPIKQHPIKDKSYIFLKGKEDINIFNKSGKLIKKIRLNLETRSSGFRKKRGTTIFQ